jgi:hypothetical protein
VQRGLRALEEDGGKVKKAKVKKMLDGGLFGGNPADDKSNAGLVASFDELYASVTSGGTKGCTEGHRPADPHRPALTAHTENIARWAARFFGKEQIT